jgi:hypothetical protein
MPAVADLDRAGQRPPHRLAVSAGAVAADDLDAGMPAQPCLDDVGGAAGQHVDAPPGLGVDEHGGVAAAAAQREVIDAQHPRHRQCGQRDPQQDPQHRVPGSQDAQRLKQPCPGPAR